MYPPRWGPTFWTFLHAVVECNRDPISGASVWSDDLWDIIESTIAVIPCPQCLLEASSYLVTYGRIGTDGADHAQVRQDTGARLRQVG